MGGKYSNGSSSLAFLAISLFVAGRTMLQLNVPGTGLQTSANKQQSERQNHHYQGKRLTERLDIRQMLREREEERQEVKASSKIRGSKAGLQAQKSAPRRSLLQTPPPPGPARAPPDPKPKSQSWGTDLFLSSSSKGVVSAYERFFPSLAKLHESPA